MIDLLKKNKFLWSIFSYILRFNYSFFWKYRDLENLDEKESLKTYLEDEILLNFFNNKPDENLKIIELGCGYGLRLFNLKEIKKNYSLSGYDINKRYIDFAKKYDNKKKMKIEFFDKKIEDIKLNEDIDYIISSFTLIYLKNLQIIKFFLNNKDRIKKGFIFIEYHSEHKSKNLSYYVHNFKKIFESSNLENFKIEFKKINYKRWIKEDHEAYRIIGNVNENEN